MTVEDYNNRLSFLKLRLDNAIKAHCHRTARARIRDIARLAEDYNATPYGETYDKLKIKYNL